MKFENSQFVEIVAIPISLLENWTDSIPTIGKLDFDSIWNGNLMVKIRTIVDQLFPLLENWDKFNFTRLEDSTNFLSTRIRKLAQFHESSGIGSDN